MKMGCRDYLGKDKISFIYLLNTLFAERIGEKNWINFDPWNAFKASQNPLPNLSYSHIIYNPYSNERFIVSHKFLQAFKKYMVFSPKQLTTEMRLVNLFRLTKKISIEHVGKLDWMYKPNQ